MPVQIGLRCHLLIVSVPVNKNPYRSEEVASQLCDAARAALLTASFNGRSWVLKSPPDDAVLALLPLKLLRESSGDFEVTIAGMAIRATVARHVRRQAAPKAIASDLCKSPHRRS